MSRSASQSSSYSDADDHHHHHQDENQTVQKIPPNAKLHLTLDNFESDDVPSDYPYVLTSPRSLAACKHFGVRPVDLLPFRIEDARRQLELEGDFSFEALTLLREAEQERREILEKCRQLRDEWIKEDEKRLDRESATSLFEDENETGDDGENSLNQNQESLSDIEKSRKDNLLTRPFLKLSEEVKDFLDNHSQQSFVSSGRNCSSPYTSSDRPEADQSFEEEEISDDAFQGTSSDCDDSISPLENSLSRNLSRQDEDFVNEQDLETYQLKKSSNYQDLSKFRREDGSPSPTRNRCHRPSVTFCESPVVLVVVQTSRKRSSSNSEKVFQNPYGPPLYFHSRPAIMNPILIANNNNNNINNNNNNNNNGNSKSKKKARRIKRILPSNFNVSPALMTSQIIDVDVDDAPESDRCCQRTTNNVEETKSQSDTPTKIRWKIRSSSSFRPSERTSKLMESLNQKLETAKASTIKLANGEVDLETLNLPNHDRRILERLQMKRAKEEAAKELAHVQHMVWREENQHLERERSMFESNWKKRVEQKRTQESLLNEQRLLEARKLFQESQDLLKRLIKEKDERARQFVHDAQRRKAENSAEWRMSEEVRRVAVENALEELLARDTQYRKELKFHLESRILAAELRRRSHQEKVKENIAALNEFYNERHRNLYSEIEQSQTEKLLSIRQEIEERVSRVTNVPTLKSKDKTLHKLRMERALKNEKARKLKLELDEALDKWRNQVLEVQTRSIQAAEERARLFLNQRKLRLASLHRGRRDRHEEALQKVRKFGEEVENETWKSIKDKDQKFEKWSEERQIALEKARQLAQKTADLRQAIRNQSSPDSFDKLVARANLEAKITQLQEYYV